VAQHIARKGPPFIDSGQIAHGLVLQEAKRRLSDFDTAPILALVSPLLTDASGYRQLPIVQQEGVIPQFDAFDGGGRDVGARTGADGHDRFLEHAMAIGLVQGLERRLAAVSVEKSLQLVAQAADSHELTSERVEQGPVVVLGRTL
jgi:hypothetical protein